MSVLPNKMLNGALCAQPFNESIGLKDYTHSGDFVRLHYITKQEAVRLTIFVILSYLWWCHMTNLCNLNAWILSKLSSGKK